MGITKPPVDSASWPGGVADDEAGIVVAELLCCSPSRFLVGDDPDVKLGQDCGQAPAYVNFEDESGRRSAAKLLTKDEARRIAANIAKLTS